MIKKLLVGLVTLAFGTVAFASGDTFVEPPAVTNSFAPGIYVGAQAGYGMTNWDNVELNTNVDGVSISNEVTGSNAFAGRAFLGYDFHPNFAIEAGYTQFFNNTKINIMNQTISNPRNDYAIDLVGKLKAIIVDNFGLYTKLGVDYIHVDEEVKSLPGSNTNPPNQVSAFNIVYGAGAFYEITQNLTADLSWTRFNGDPKLSKDYIPAHDLFAVGVFWKFNLA